MGKLNWQISPSTRSVANFDYDKRNDDYGIGVTQAPTEAFTRHGKTPTPGVAYTGVLSDKHGPRPALLGLLRHGSRAVPPIRSQPRDLTRFYDLDTGVISGGHYYWYDTEPDQRHTSTAKISHLADNFLGAGHDFHFGVQYSDAVAKGIYGYNDFVYTYAYDGHQATATATSDSPSATAATAGTSASSSTTPCG